MCLAQQLLCVVVASADHNVCVCLPLSPLFFIKLICKINDETHTQTWHRQAAWELLGELLGDIVTICQQMFGCRVMQTAVEIVTGAGQAMVRMQHAPESSTVPCHVLHAASLAH
jgi:hypothetical protein